MADAIALSKSTESEPKPTPVTPQTPQTPTSEQSNMSIDTTMFTDEDMDEEMKLALMLSMQEPPKAESPKVQPPKCNNRLYVSINSLASDQKPPLPSQPVPAPEPKPEQPPAPVPFTFIPPVPPPTGQAPPLPFSFGNLSPFNFGGQPPSSNQSPRRNRRSRSKSPTRPAPSESNAASANAPSQAPATPVTAPSAPNPPATTPAPQAKSPLLPWFSKVLEAKRTLETLVSPEKYQTYLRELIKKAWTAAKKETIKERILLVDNLPLLDADKREELENILRRAFGEIALMENEVFMPLDEHGKQVLLF